MVIFVRRCCCNTSIPRIILRIAMLSTQLYWILAQWLRCLEQITWTKEFLEFFFWFAYYFSRCVESWNYSHISYISIMIFSCFHLFIFDLHSKPPWCLNIPVFLSYESARQDTHGTLAWGRALHLGFESLKVEQFASNFHPFFMVRQCESGPHFTLTCSCLPYLTFPMSLIPRVRPTLDLHYVLFAPPARAAAPVTFNCSHQFGSWRKAWMKHSTLTEISVNGSRNRAWQFYRKKRNQTLSHSSLACWLAPATKNKHRPCWNQIYMTIGQASQWAYLATFVSLRLSLGETLKGFRKMVFWCFLSIVSSQVEVFILTSGIDKWIANKVAKIRSLTLKLRPAGDPGLCLSSRLRRCTSSQKLVPCRNEETNLWWSMNVSKRCEDVHQSDKNEGPNLSWDLFFFFLLLSFSFAFCSPFILYLYCFGEMHFRHVVFGD